MLDLDASEVGASDMFASARDRQQPAVESGAPQKYFCRAEFESLILVGFVSFTHAKVPCLMKLPHGAAGATGALCVLCGCPSVRPSDRRLAPVV